MLPSTRRLLALASLLALPAWAGDPNPQILPLEPIGNIESFVIAPLGVAYKPDSEGGKGGKLFAGHFALVQEFPIQPKGSGFKLGDEDEAFRVLAPVRISGIDARTSGSLLLSFNNENSAGIGEYLDFGFPVNSPLGIALATCDPSNPAAGLLPCVVEHPEGVAFDDDRTQLWVAGEPASTQKGRLVVYEGFNFTGNDRPVLAIFSTPCPAEELDWDPEGVPNLCIEAADPLDPPLNDPSGIDIDPSSGNLLVVQDANSGPGAIYEIAVDYDGDGVPSGAQIVAIQELCEPLLGGCLDAESVSLGAGDLAGLVFVGLEDEEQVAVFAGAPPGQTKEQQKCILSAHKGSAGLAKASFKDLQGCLKAAASGAQVGACLDTATGNLAKAVAKADASLAKSCGGTAPDYGVDVENLVDAGTAGPGELAEALFGADLDAAAADGSTDKDGAKCQADLVKLIAKLYGTEWKTVAKALKGALVGKLRVEGSGPVDSADQLATELFAALEAGSGDGGKIAKALAQLAEKLGRCDTALASVAELFPGDCSAAGDGAALGECAGEVTQCRFCRSLEASTDLSLECETLDDGADNGSCPAP